MLRVILISALFLMACANLTLDFFQGNSLSNFTSKTLLMTVGISFISVLPSLSASIVAERSSFKIFRVRVYRFAADVVLGISLIAWCYLLFIRERPEIYDGASHMYIVTWPIAIGLLALFLFLVVLFVQLSIWIYLSVIQKVFTSNTSET